MLKIIFTLFFVLFIEGKSFALNANEDALRQVKVFQSIFGQTEFVSFNEEKNDLHLESSSSSIAYKIHVTSLNNITQVQYRLDGFDKGWNDVSGGDFVINYPFLSPGHYQFQVKITKKDSLNDFIYKANDVWVVSSWGKLSYWLVAAAIIMLLCFILLDAEFLRKIILRYKNKCEVSVNEKSENFIKENPTISTQFLDSIISECHSSLMMLSEESLFNRGISRLQALFSELRRWEKIEKYGRVNTSIVLRSWLIPKLNAIFEHSKNENVRLKSLIIPDVITTLNSDLLNAWVDFVCVQIKSIDHNNLDVLISCILNLDNHLFEIHINYSTEIGDLRHDLFNVDDNIFQSLNHLLITEGGCSEFFSEESNFNLIIKFPATWSLIDFVGEIESDMYFPIAPTHAHRILIVESDPDIQKYILKMLGECYQLHFSSTIRGVFTHIEESEIDLVLCSARWLPDGSVNELYTKFKINEISNYLPFILCSMNPNELSESQAWDAFIDDYISLPLEPKLFLSRLKSIFENRERTKKWLMKNLITDNKQDNNPTGIIRYSPIEQQFLESLKLWTLKLLNQGAISLDNLSKELGLSGRTLQRKLQAILSVSYVDYVREIQMQLVVEQLQQGATVKMAARIAGFNDQAYLTRVFKQTFNMSPTEYRKRYVSANSK